MPHSLLITFDKHPRQRELIGNLILAYGELEFILQDILRAVLDDDLMTATRTLYRLRSEANRLSVADAIIRPKMEAQGILPAYLDAYCAMFACKNVRNRYAHAQYIVEHGELWVGDLDLAAIVRADRENPVQASDAQASETGMGILLLRRPRAHLCSEPIQDKNWSAASSRSGNSKA
jgi:hypothetical protein